MLTRLDRSIEWLAKWFAYAAAFLIFAMSFWITYDVLARNLFGIGSPWFFDLSEYALVWITFLGAPWVLLRDRHVRIEILVDALPVAVQRVLGVVVSVVAMLICAVLTWRTGIAALEYYQNDVMMPRIWRIPRIWPYVIVPVGSGFLVLAFAVRLVHYLTRKDPEAELRAAAAAGQETGVSSDA
jgi:TRAP-type C4-dicarboxylate transport system permease small subunit